MEQADDVRKRILLVDDSKLVLEVERSLLKRTRAEIFTASSGMEGIKQAHDQRPDLVMLDFMLPDLTGDRVCAQLKNNPETSHIPVVMVTTRTKPEEVERCRRAGCDDYLVKPLNYEEMLMKAARLLRIPHRLTQRMMVRIEVHLGDDDQVLFGSSVDLSTTGMLIETSRRLPIDDVIDLRFLLEGREEIVTRARVVRSESRLFRKLGYGLHFEEMSDEHATALRHFITRCNALQD